MLEICLADSWTSGHVLVGRATDRSSVIRQIRVELMTVGGRTVTLRFGRFSGVRGGKKSMTWLIATMIIVAGIAMLIAVDLIEDPDSTPLDVALNLLEEAPLFIIAIGGVVLFQSLQRERKENHRILTDLEMAKREGQQWRKQVQGHLQGLGLAIRTQLLEWNLTAAEREVALLLLKGLSSKEIGTVRATSERTVREQARSVYLKAGLNGRASLSAYFLEDLLAPVDSIGISPTVE